MKIKSGITGCLFLLFVFIFPLNVKASDITNDIIEWTQADFTYTEYSKTLYGCDYTREFTIKGQAISGLSEEGKEKLKNTTELVIPAFDVDGNKIVGIADNAFSKCGLTKVTFPTGMMVEYDDTITNKVTKRGNFIIGSSAFSGNELTEVYLPEGVIAILPNAFQNNKLQEVSLPHTIWWIETLSFSGNELTTVDFPKTCDFQLEIHGMAFAKNNIKWVRLPNYVEVVHKYAFYFNPGMEECPDDAPDEEKGGVVYMYTDNAALKEKDRIHHIEKKAEVQLSWHQKLLVKTAPSVETAWDLQDFTYEGTMITGFSESGLEKRMEQSHLILPDKNPEGKYITAIADASPGGYGLFASEECQFEKLTLPVKLKKIGAYAFQNNGLREITEFPGTLTEIGSVAFQMNQLTSVVLPDSVTILESGAFATNPSLNTILLSKGLTEIAPSAFGCSDKTHYMTELTELSLHEGITTIGNRAFAGNNIKNIKIPKTVTEIGNYAFSTKNYLDDTCTLELSEGLTIIGEYAFRNKVIEKVMLPSTVKGLPANVFLKEYSTDVEAVVTKVYVTETQINDETAFPKSSYHTLLLWEDDSTVDQPSEDDKVPEWTDEDFLFDGSTILGWSDKGQETRLNNKNLIIPAYNPQTGEKITAIGESAFAIPDKEVEQMKSGVYSPNGMLSVQIPDTVTEIGHRAFRYNSLTEVSLPNVLKTIGKQAFHGNQLEKLHLPDSVTTVDEGAFSTNNITELTLSKAMTTIEAGTFSMNIRLENIVLHEGITRIEATAFAGARLTSLKIPSTVTYVGKKAFHLHHLEELTVPGNVKIICESAFEGTPKGITLKKLVLEEGIETIDSRAFAYGYLEKVILPNSLKTLAADAFADNAGIVLKTAEDKEPTHKVTPSDNLKAVLAAHDNVKLSWNKSEGANYYYIYYKKAEVKNYSYLGRTKNTSYVTKNLTDGIKYQFLVVPSYVKNGKVAAEGYSDIVSIYTLKKVAKPTVKKLSSKMKVLWKNISGESGYQISVSTVKSKTNIVSTYKTTNGTSRMLSVKKGKTYYVKVRAYRNVNGKKVTGPWSKVTVYKAK